MKSYLVIKKIIEIAKKSKSDAIHPGYGFLSENYNFVKALEKEKIKFIGPNKYAITKMGDKIESKNLATKLKLNVIPGHTEAIKDPKKAIKIAVNSKTQTAEGFLRWWRQRHASRSLTQTSLK